MYDLNEAICVEMLLYVLEKLGRQDRNVVTLMI